jgi:hypothetical protein
MNQPLTLLHGVLKKGYGVASGPSADYPYGSLERQIPIFKAGGLDLTRYFFGTLNIDISPFTFAFVKPEFTFRDVLCTDLHPPENFSLARCQIVFKTVPHDGWIYYPHPETKLRNFQDPSLLEVITSYLANIHPGDTLDVLADPERLVVHK